MKVIKINLVLISLVLLAGCGKTYTDYPNQWVSKDKCIRINTQNCTAVLNYPQIDSQKVINILSNGYERDLYFCYGESVGEGDPTSCIWEADASIKKDKLYLTIVEDNFTKMEGTVIVLEQEKTNQK